MSRVSILGMAIDLINIHQDIWHRLRGYDTGDFWIYDFDQTWGSPALGFGGCGGSAMTTARTYILIAKNDLKHAYVYFSGRYAYTAFVNDAFCEDMDKYQMASVQVAASRYKATSTDE